MKKRTYLDGVVYLGDALGVLTTAKDASLVYMDPPFCTQKKQSGPAGSYNDVWASVESYIEILSHYVTTAKYHTLSRTGVMVIHVDWRVSHLVRLALDEIFTKELFVNEVIWCYASGGAGKRHFARKHDNLFVYAMSPTYTFNILREPYPNDYGNRPGFHPEGRAMNDWWTIPILSTSALERTGYPNQKPVELIARLIRAFTNPGDLVVDPFVGSGTTAVAARQEGRTFLVGDRNPEAFASTKKRLNADPRMK